MKHNIREVQNEQGDTCVTRRFYFKVNSSKIEDEIKFERQVNKVIDRITRKYKLLNNEIKMEIGTIEDDLIFDRFRLIISVNCA